MTGWRIGYLAASPEIVRVAGKLFQHTISCTSGFIQKAAAMAFECGEEIEAMRRTYQERRDFFRRRSERRSRRALRAARGGFLCLDEIRSPRHGFEPGRRVYPEQRQGGGRARRFLWRRKGLLDAFFLCDRRRAAAPCRGKHRENDERAEKIT